MILALLLQAAALVGPPEKLPAMHVEGDYLLLRHLVAARSIPPSLDGDFRLLRAPDGARSILLTHQDQATLLRRRLPTLTLRPQAATSLRVEFDRRAVPATEIRCFATNQPIGVGEWIDTARAERVPCDAGRNRAKLRYDASVRAPRAVADLAAGSYLGAVALPSALPQSRGNELTMRTRVGPVTIDRSAILLQPARAGRRAFVKLSDGSIIAARLADEGEK